MNRATLAVTLMGLALTSCAPAAAPMTLTAQPIPSSEPVSPRPAGADSTASATPLASAASHVAAGLSFVRPVGSAGIGEVFVVDVEGDVHQLTGLDPLTGLGASVPTWSPNGSMIAFGPPKVGAGGQRFLSVIHADGGGQRTIASLADEFGVPFSWSPEGASLLYFDIDAADGPEMWLADVASGEIRSLGVGQVPRWLPDGQRISFLRAVESREPGHAGALTQTVSVLDLTSGEVVEFANASDALWSPDGSAVLLTQDDGDIIIANADGSKPRVLVRGWGPVWSRDSSRVAVTHGHNEDGVPLLAVVDREGQPVWAGVPGSVPSWSPDGARIAVEVSYPYSIVRVLDAINGEILWETEGSQPGWPS